MTATKQSFILKANTKHGGQVTEYHTSEYAAQQGLANMIKSGIEVKDAEVSCEADRGTPQGMGPETRLKAYSEVE